MQDYKPTYIVMQTADGWKATDTFGEPMPLEIIYQLLWSHGKVAA